MNQQEFNLANYVVCNYCSNTVIGSHRDGYEQGCKLVKNRDGKFAKIEFPDNIQEKRREGVDCFSMERGCENFDPNNILAHPSVLEKLIKKNFKCKSIISDTNTPNRTHWDFKEALMGCLPSSSRVDYMDIQG